MLSAVTLAIITAVVVSHSGLYVDNENLKIIAFHPNEILLTESLKPGGNVVGFTYLKGAPKPYVILKFENVPKNSALVIKVVSVFKGKKEQPAKLKIYVSKDLKNWNFVKEMFATEGNHTIPIPPINKTVYVKIEVTGGVENYGSSLVDAIYITTKPQFVKLDLKNWQIYVANMWVNLSLLPLMFLCSLVVTRKVQYAMIPFVLPLVLNLMFDIDLYAFTTLFDNPYMLTLDTAILSLIFLVLCKIFNYRTKNTQD